MRGFKDNLPPQSYAIEYIKNIFEAFSKKYGCDYVDLPVVEDAQLYFRTSGADSDVCNKELFEVRRYKDDFQDWVLRPEGTASFMRALKEANFLHDQKEVRAAYFAPMFRYNRPQKGRYRQFLQAGWEWVGNDSVYIDFEMLCAVVEMLEAFELDFVLELNSIGNVQDRINYRSQLKEKLNLADDIDPLKILDKAETFDNIPHMQLNDADAKRFEKTLAMLDASNIKYVHNPYLVRGLDYYNALVFECKVNGQTVLAGGRYDGLMQQLDGGNICAIGFAAGVERIAEAIKYQHCNKKIAIIPIDSFEYVAQVMKKIRSEYADGCIVFWEWNLKKALATASKQNFEYVIICGADEEKKAEFILKNLVDGKQKVCKMNELFQL